MLRRINIITVIGMLVTTLIHGVLGSLQMMGISDTAVKSVAWVSVGFISVHTIIGFILTIQTLIARKKAGAYYFKENLLFWARRDSGICIILTLVLHLVVFRSSNADVYRLQPFETWKLITQILLVLSIAVHVITNVKPALITFGIKKLKPRAGDILFVVSIILMFFIIAFIIYYVRWHTV